MRFDVVTLFPEMFTGYLGQSLLNKAIQAGIVNVQLHDLRRWSRDKHQNVDDRPFGGGPGMVLKVEPVVECVEEVQTLDERPGHVVLLTPTGKRLKQPVVENLYEKGRLILLCGRYEGFDQRVIDILKPQELSVGDYVLNGGEVAAMIVVDTVIRLVPHVLGDERSSVDDSFSNPERSLEHAQYTRPREYRGHVVPDVLISGNHQQIAAWRKAQRDQKTRARQVNENESSEP
jgi:tRNA (guanine37-N1)-methyltransferase